MKNFLNKTGKALATLLSLPLVGLLVVASVLPITITCILALLQGEFKYYYDRTKSNWKLFKYGMKKIIEGSQIRLTTISRIDDLTRVDSMETKSEKIY